MSACGSEHTLLGADAETGEVYEWASTYMSVCCQILVLCCSDVPSNSNTAPSTLVAHTFALCHRMLFINMQEEGGAVAT